MRLLNALLKRKWPTALQNGGSVSIYAHPKGIVIVPLIRLAAKAGAFRSMYTALPHDWQRLAPDVDAAELADAVRRAFAGIETFPNSSTYSDLIAKSTSAWSEREPLREALELSKSARFWPLMTLLHVNGVGENFVLSATRALRGGAFEGVAGIPDKSVPHAADDTAFGAALLDMLEECQ